VPTPKGAEGTVAALEKLFGKKVHFFESAGDFDINGMFSKQDPTHIFINTNTLNPVNSVIGHELVHSLRTDNSELYDDLVDIAKSILTTTDGSFEAVMVKYVAQLRAAKAAEGVQTTEEALMDEATEEFIADELGGMLLDGWFLAEVYKGNETLFTRIMAAIDSILIRVRTTIAPTHHSAIDAIMPLDQRPLANSEVVTRRPWPVRSRAQSAVMMPP
jgi:hypothetical protein